jgi:hypothetical protein
MELRKSFLGSIHTYVALAIFGMAIHAQIGLAVAAGAPVAAGKVESLEQLWCGPSQCRATLGAFAHQ